MKASSHFVSSNGLDIHYLRWGEHSPAVVLLHGLTSCAHTWSQVAPYLAANFQLYAPDLRGHGDTDKPDGGYDFATLTADLEGFLNGLGLEKAAVIGQSWGASVALAFAAAHPERVTHLALVEGGYFSRDLVTDLHQEQWEQMLAPLEIYASKETYLKAASHGLEEVWNQELEDILLASIYFNPDGSVREKLDRGHQVLILRSSWGFRPVEFLPKVRCPVLVVAARNQDPQMQRFTALKELSLTRIKDALPSATTHWMEDSIHDIQLQRPQALADVLKEFIKADGR